MTADQDVAPLVLDQPAVDAHIRRHVLIDAWGSPAERLDDPDGVRAAIENVVKILDATLIELSLRRFSPQGVTAVAMLAESHLAVHTWPELNYFAADLFYCGTGDSVKAIQALVETLGAIEVRTHHIARGPNQIARPVDAPAPEGNR